MSVKALTVVAAGMVFGGVILTTQADEPAPTEPAPPVEAVAPAEPASAAPAEAEAAVPTPVAARLAFLPDVLATYDTDQSVTRDEFVDLMGDQLGFVLQADMTDDKIRVETKPMIESIVSSRILAACATEAGQKPDTAAATQMVKQAVAMNGPDVLGGQSEAEVIALVAERNMIMAWIDAAIVPGIEIEAADIAAFYEAHKHEIPAVPAQVAASHILVSYKGAMRANPAVTRTKDEALARATDIQAKAAAEGADFAALAREYSDGPSGPQGGSLGQFTREQMVKPFSDAAFAMEPGDTSGVVESDFGFHIIRVTGKTAAGARPLDDELKGMIESHLRETKVNDAVVARLDEESAKRNVKYAY